MTKEQSRKYYREYARKWRSNPDNRRKELDRKIIKESKNRDEVNKKTREYRSKNIEKDRARCRDYKKNNKHIVNENLMRRYFKKKKSSIHLSEHSAEIQSIYKKCTTLEKETQIEHNVDHIIPLIHPDVCGLHVPWNLQVLTAKDNQQKSNKFDGTFENESWRVNATF